MKKEIIMASIPYVFGIILVLYILNRLKKGTESAIESVKTGDFLLSDVELKTNEEIKVKTAESAKTWLQKELSLPINQRSRIKKQTAQDIADKIHMELRNQVQTMTGANQIVRLLESPTTLGGLYFILSAFGVRDGLNLNQYLYKKLGYNNVFSKDLDDVNETYEKRKINFKF